MPQITGTTITMVSLMLFGLNSQMVLSKRSYDYYGQPSSDYEFTGYLGAKTYKYDSGSYVFSDYDAKDAIYKKNFTMAYNDWGEGGSYYGWGMIKCYVQPFIQS